MFVILCNAHQQQHAMSLYQQQYDLMIFTVNEIADQMIVAYWY